MTENKTDNSAQRIQWRVAVVGALSALVGALIGGAATFSGVVYQNHIMAATQLQSERKGAYIAYDAELQTMRNDLESVYIDDQVGISSSKDFNKFQTDARSFYETEGQLSLIASPMIYQNVQLQQESTLFLAQELSGLNLKAVGPLLRHKVESDVAYYNQLANRFTNLARTDLGTG